MRLFCVAATRRERARGERVDGEGGEEVVRGGNRAVPALVFFSMFFSFFSYVVDVKRPCAKKRYTSQTPLLVAPS